MYILNSIYFFYFYTISYFYFSSFYFSLSRVWIWRQFIFFLLCLIHTKSHLQLFIQIIPGFLQMGSLYLAAYFFFIFRLSMQYTHVIGELINSYARILSCVFLAPNSNRKKNCHYITYNPTTLVKIYFMLPDWKKCFLFFFYFAWYI